MIEFRTVALITLWTMLVGPVFNMAPAPSKAPTARTASVLARR